MEERKKNSDSIDYYDLWKYFNDRMMTLKDALLQVLSWLMAFTLAIVGFVVQKDLVEFHNGLFTVEDGNTYAVATFAVLGILLCFYCFYLIYAYGVLINENWVVAGRLRDELASITEIYPEKPDRKKKRLHYQNLLESNKKICVVQNIIKLPPFCMKVSVPIIVFLVVFGWMLVNAAL